MKKRKSKPNKLNRSGIQALKEQLDNAWPNASMKKAGYIRDLAPLGLTSDPALRQKVVSAAIETRPGEATVRIYRKSEPSDHHDYDVDEIRGADQSTVTRPEKSEISNHWLTGTIEDDLMSRNNMTIELVPDGEGGLLPNVQADGTVEAFINFEDDIPLDETTPGEQTWFCRLCRKRFTTRYNHKSIDGMMLTHLFRRQHLTKSPECLGEIEILIPSTLTEDEKSEIRDYAPA